MFLLANNKKDGIDTKTAGRLQICSIFGVARLTGGHSGIVDVDTKRNYFREYCESDLTGLSTNPSSYLSNTWWFFPPDLKWSKRYEISVTNADEDGNVKVDTTWHTNSGLESASDLEENKTGVLCKAFTIEINGNCGILTLHATVTTEEVRNVFTHKELPQGIFFPDSPTNISIGGGGGLEEDPNIEDFFEQIIEGMDEATFNKEASMDGLFEQTTESYNEDMMDQEIAPEMEADIDEERMQEHEETEEKQEEDESSAEDHAANQAENEGDQQIEE